MGSGHEQETAYYSAVCFYEAPCRLLAGDAVMVALLKKTVNCLTFASIFTTISAKHRTLGTLA